MLNQKTASILSTQLLVAASVIDALDTSKNKILTKERLIGFASDLGLVSVSDYSSDKFLQVVHKLTSMVDSSSSKVGNLVINQIRSDKQRISGAKISFHDDNSGLNVFISLTQTRLIFDIVVINKDLFAPTLQTLFSYRLSSITGDQYFKYEAGAAASGTAETIKKIVYAASLYLSKEDPIYARKFELINSFMNPLEDQMTNYKDHV